MLTLCVIFTIVFLLKWQVFVSVDYLWSYRNKIITINKQLHISPPNSPDSTIVSHASVSLSWMSYIHGIMKYFHFKGICKSQLLLPYFLLHLVFSDLYNKSHNFGPTGTLQEK
jgi:hypothetical protein